MQNYDKLLQIGEQALSYCSKIGADQAEVFLTKKNLSTIATSFKAQQFNEVVSQSEAIIGLAVSVKMHDTHFGFTHSSDFEEEALQEVIKGAADSAVPRTEFTGFNTKGGTTDVPKLYDPVIKDFINEPSALKEILVRAKNQVSIIPEVNLTDCAISSVAIDTVIMNTNGIKLTNSGSFFAFTLNTSHQSKELHTHTFRHHVNRTLDDLTVEKYIKEAAEESLMMTKLSRIEDTTCPATLTSRAAADLYGYQFDTSIAVNGVVAGYSKLGDKLGEQVATPEFTLYDDATLSGGQYSNTFDDEGSPSKKTIIIENGILKSFLSNTYYASRNKSETTSNSTRSANRQINDYYTREYTYRPTISTTNFCVAPGDASNEELISEMKNGLLVNVITGGITVVDLGGDFNVQGLHLYKVENGEIVGAISDAAIKGNWYKIFRDVQMVGKEPERSMSSLGANSYVWPNILVRELQFKPM